MMLFALFFLLALLFAVEACTALARVAGYRAGRPEAGLMLQSSLGLLSRLLIFMFMPLLGWMADSGNMYDDYGDLLLGYLPIPVVLLAVYGARSYIEVFFVKLVLGVTEHGSLFRRAVNETTELRMCKINRLPKSLRGFIFLYFMTYIPYYVAWPLIIVLIDLFPDSRGVLLGLSGVFNGLNTLMLTMFVDPRLIRYGRKYNFICRLYPYLIKVRIGVAISIVFLSGGIFFVDFCCEV